MVKPTSGRVLIDGQEVSGTSPKVGYMLQHDHLFEWRNILSNLLVGAEIRKMDLKKAEHKALDLMERYGLGGFAHHSPSQLSGGMRQRVALIRTLVTEPDILLLDEPFSALDYQTRLTLADEIYGIIKDQGKTAILVTHDISEAISMADRVMVMSKRPSTISTVYSIQLGEGTDVTPWKSGKQFAIRNTSMSYGRSWKDMSSLPASEPSVVTEARIEQVPTLITVKDKPRSPQYHQYLKTQKRRLWMIRLAQLLVFTAFIVLWELAAQWKWVDSMLTSRPSQLITSFQELAVKGIYSSIHGRPAWRP